MPELLSLVTYIVLAGYTPSSYAQFIHSTPTFQLHVLITSLIPLCEPYAPIICPNYMLKLYA